MINVDVIRKDSVSNRQQNLELTNC